MTSHDSKNIVILLFLTIFFGIPSLLLAIYVISAKPSEQMHALRGYEGSLVNVASEHVDSFLAENKRLPTYAEFDKWVSSRENENSGLSGYGFYLNTSELPKDLIQNIGDRPVNGYVINFWTGDVTASYVSWNPKINTAYVPDKEYFPFGSKIASTAIFLAIPVGLSFLWLRKTKQ